MVLGHWIAIVILILAIIALIGGILYFMNRLSEPLDHLDQLQENIQTQADHYQKEVQFLSDKIEVQTNKAKYIAQEAQKGANQFNRLQGESQKLASQLNYISQMRKDVARAAVEEGKNYIQETLPRKVNKWKTISQKTIQKQKERYSK